MPTSHTLHTLTPFHPTPQVLEACNNGFEIAEQDLRFRGAGQVFGTGTRQSGAHVFQGVSQRGTTKGLLMKRFRLARSSSNEVRGDGSCTGVSGLGIGFRAYGFENCEGVWIRVGARLM